MEDNVTPWWGGEIIDEEEPSPEERAQFPWNDPDDEERPLGLWIVDEEESDYEEQSTYKEEPDINLIYGYYEESEFY